MTLRNQNRKLVLYVFFPVTAYLFVGTALFFLLSKTDQLSEKCGNLSEFPGLEFYKATDWHTESVWLTIFFPIVWPLIAVWVLLVFIYAVVAFLLRAIYEILIHIKDAVVDLVTLIWRKTIESIEYIWETVKGIFPQ